MDPRLRPKGMITLVNRYSTSIYSGMFPGLIAGKYNLEDIQIDLRKLANAAGVVFVEAEINGVDTYKKFLKFNNRNSLEFSHLSLDVGGETVLNSSNAKLVMNNQACPIKPFKDSYEWVRKFEKENYKSTDKDFTIIGSGIAAVEISLALRRRWPKQNINIQVYESNLISKFRDILLNSNIKIIEKQNAKKNYSALICTGSTAPKWLKESGFKLNKNGRIVTYNTFEIINYKNFFAAGDCSVINHYVRPASGVWAVKAAKPLARNLEKALNGLPLSSWKPQKNALQLIGINYDNKLPLAFATWGNFSYGPVKWLWKFKENIDKNFLKKFDITKEMYSHDSNKITSCRGCGAKVGASTLIDALKAVGLNELANEPEDAALVSSSPINGNLIQSVDGFPALISDPWLNARLTTLHACSDIWAVGAEVKSVQAIISLPEVGSDLQRILLQQCLGGIKSAIEPQGALLIGGHTYESRSLLNKPITLGIEISLIVNGTLQLSSLPLRKSGMEPGDQLLLSRGLGSGVIFAAEMEGVAKAEDLDSALLELSRSQHSLLNFRKNKNNFEKILINASTDVTGFGLLGHLGEMVLSSNQKRSLKGLSRIKVSLDAETIPFLKGAKSLFKKGYRSSLADSNSKAWSLLEANQGLSASIELKFQDKNPTTQQIKLIKELIIDPQTCGPLLISCDFDTAKNLVKNFSWIKIGSVK